MGSQECGHGSAGHEPSYSHRGDERARDAEPPAPRPEQNKTHEQRHPARHDRRVESARAIGPRLVRLKTEIEVRPDERRQASPGAKQDESEPGHRAPVARHSHGTAHFKFPLSAYSASSVARPPG